MAPFLDPAQEGIPEITLCTLQQYIPRLKPIKSLFFAGTFCALICFAARIRQRSEQLFQSTYDSYNGLVYYISQNQVLGQGININVLLHTFPRALICWPKVWTNWSETKTGCVTDAAEKVEVFAAGNELSLMVCLYLCWVICAANVTHHHRWNLWTHEDMCKFSTITRQQLNEEMSFVF